MFSIWISNRNYGMMLDPPRGMRLIGQFLSEVLRHAKLCERDIALLTIRLDLRHTRRGIEYSILRIRFALVNF